MYSSHMLHEGARPEIVRDILGHTNIYVTQNVYGWLAITVACFGFQFSIFGDCGNLFSQFRHLNPLWPAIPAINTGVREKVLRIRARALGGP